MIIVGFYKGHNATACILKDGKILAAVSEERFNRVKNADVFPAQAINYCLKETGVQVSDVDFFVRTYTHPEGYISKSGETRMPKVLEILSPVLALTRKLVFLMPALIPLAVKAYEIIYAKVLTPYYQNQFSSTMADFLKIDKEKIIFADHHLCHAYAAYYGFVPKEKQKKDFLVITLDGAGDGDCGGVWKVSSGIWKRIAKTPAGNSIALFYGYITQFLGMKFNEHEYKVMGLAPYVSTYEIDRIYPLFKGLFSVGDNLVVHSKFLSGSYMHYFDKHLAHKRFDGIAAATQNLAEEVSTELVKKAVKKTGIKNITVGGGFFMNIKANKKISELPSVQSLIPCPSAADESTVFGAAYFGYELLCKQKDTLFNPDNIGNLYLGPQFSDKEIEKIIDQKEIKKKYLVKRYGDIEEKIVKLLIDGQIVARFKGRMEWGARALGNRSILMDPRRKDLIQKLNQQIKSRDFWMPFAASILEEYEERYLKIIKKIDGRFMIMAFDTTKEGKEDLAAAIHSYDATCRPQIVREIDNPSYYRLIKYFEEKTGVGAVLNTSFNYHGEPIVCTPEDALHTFEVTGLQYLALGSYLICKE